MTSTPPDESFYTPLHWCDFCNALEILNGFHLERRIGLPSLSNLDYCLELIRKGSECISGNKDVQFRLTGKELDVSFLASLRDHVLQKSRYIALLFRVTADLLVIFSDATDISSPNNVVQCTETLYLLYSASDLLDDVRVKILLPQIINETKSSLDYVRSLNSTPETIKLSILAIMSIIIDFEESCQLRLREVTSRDPLIAQYLHVLQATERQKCVVHNLLSMMPEPTTESEVFKILFQRISLSEKEDFEMVTSLLQLCVLMPENVDGTLISITRLTEYWKASEVQHKSMCSLLQLVVVNQANLNQTHSTEYLVSTVVPRLIIILSELDTPQTQIGMNFCTSIGLLSLVLQSEVNLDLFVNAAIPKIVKNGLTLPNENGWRDNGVKQGLLYFETCLLYGGKMTSQLITGDFEAIFGFWEMMKKRTKKGEPQILIKSFEFAMSVVKQGASKFSHDKVGMTDESSQMPPTKMPKKLMKVLLPGSLAHMFSETLSSIVNRFAGWDAGQRMESLVITLLEFGSIAIQHSLDKDILFSNYVTSIMISKLNQLEVDGTSKCDILLGWLSTLSNLLTKGCNINTLLSSGIPLLVKLSSLGNASKNYVEALESLAKRFEWNGNFDLVEDVSIVHSHITNDFDEQKAEMVTLAVLQHGKRHHVKTLRDFCALPTDEQSRRIMNFVFSHPSSDFMFQLNEVCKILNSADQITRNSKNTVLKSAVQNIITKLTTDMSQQNFTRAIAKKYSQELRKILLLKAFLGEELDKLAGSSEDSGAIMEQFTSKFPAEFMNNPSSKDTLEQLSVRMNKIATRHKEVHSMITDLLKKHLFGSTGSVQEIINNLNTAVFQLPQNASLRSHLESVGYKPQLFNQDFYCVIQTNTVASIENFKNVLIGCYGEYVDFLKEFGIKKIKFGDQGHEFIGLDNIFDMELPVEVLKSRKEAIDAKIKELLASPPQDVPSIQYPTEDRRLQIDQRLSQLTQTEIKIEYQMEKQRTASKTAEDDTTTFVVIFRNLFWTSLGTSGPQIVGCYAPDGEHAEKPIEIALKANSVVLSLYVIPNSESSTDNIQSIVSQLKPAQEIENIEALLTDNGLLVLKSYSNGHYFDSSVAWCFLFKELLVQQYVPAILVPNGFPNLRSFKTLHSFVPSEYQGSIITFKDEFFGDRKTYFDHSIDKMKEGDLIITQQNAKMISLPNYKTAIGLKPLGGVSALASQSEQRPIVQKAKAIEKDLPSTITGDVLKELAQQEGLKQQASVYGKFIQMYISKFMNQGISDESILLNGFDMERWNKKIMNKRNKTKNLDNMLMTDETRAQIVNSIISCINKRLDVLLSSDLVQLLHTSKPHFFELKIFCETALRASQNHPLQRKMAKCAASAKDILCSGCKSCIIHEMDPVIQSNIIKFVYMNEQQVWQNRGTRMENLDHFMQLLQGNKNSNQFPGVVIVHTNEEDAITVKNVVGYSVGEFCNTDTYEIITAWSHPAYKGSFNAIKLYIETMREAHVNGAKYLLCDMLKGSAERVIRASSIFCFLHRVGLTKFIILEQKPSYSVEISPNKTEQFERITLHINRFLWGLRISSWFGMDVERITSVKRISYGKIDNAAKAVTRKRSNRLGLLFLSCIGASVICAFRMWK